MNLNDNLLLIHDDSNLLNEPFPLNYIDLFSKSDDVITLSKQV